MFSVNLEKENNELVVMFKGQFDLKQAEQLYIRVQEIAPKLKKGFAVLTDLSSLEHMDLIAKSFIEKTMDILNKHGVSRVIRVIPDQKKDIGFKIMSLFHYSAEVPIHTYKSYQEVEGHFKK